MILLEIAVWAVLGLFLAGVQILATKDARLLDLLAIGVTMSIVGGFLGHGISDPGCVTGLSLGAIVSAATLAIAAMLFFELIRSPKDRSN